MAACHDHSVSHTVICCHGNKVLIVDRESKRNNQNISKVSNCAYICINIGIQIVDDMVTAVLLYSYC